MPTVPAPRGPSIGLQVGRLAQAQNPLSADAASLPGRQLEQTGQAMQRAGAQFTDLFAQRQNEANIVRVQDAQNKAVQAENTYTTNKERTGFRDQMGLAALPEKESLADLYGTKLQTTYDEIAKGLGNDAQKRMFMQWAQSRMTSFKAQVDTHMSAQFREYRDSVNDATISAAGDSILTNYEKPELVQDALAAINGAVSNKLSVAGRAPTEAAELTRKTTGAYLAKLTKSLLDNGDVTAANAILELYGKDHMTAEQLLDVKTSVKGEMDLGIAQAAVKVAATEIEREVAPTDFDKMVRITAMSESGGRETDDQGRTITSPKGAQGIMQVMAKTNLDPGFGVRPAKDKSPEERARVGRDYLDAMLRRYDGDPAKAWAAYNAGPGRLDAAIKKDPANWLAHMPGETQRYVDKNVRQMQGGGKPAMLTELDFVNRAVEAIGDNASPTQVKHTTALAKQQYALINKAKEDAADDTYAAAVQQMTQGKLTFYQLPASIRNEIPADKVSSLISLGDKLQEGPARTDPALYAVLTEPGVLATMSDAKFAALAGQLSESDFKHFAKERQEQLNPDQKGKDPGSFNRTDFNSILSSRLVQIGINPKPKGAEQAQHIGAIQKVLTDQILAHQKQVGRPLNFEEMSKVVDQWMLKSVPQKQTFMGMQFGDAEPRRLLAVGADDIPASERQKIVASLKRNGVANPTDADVLNLYYRARR